MAKAVEKTYEASRERVYAAVVAAVSESGWSVSHTDATAGTVSFGTGMSMRSWSGQNMTATVIATAPDQSRVVVGGKREQKGNPFGGGGGQVFDWGEKGKIAREFFATLDRILPNMPEPPSAPSENQLSTADELAKLADLQTKGLLTAEEFAAAKSKLLGNG